MPTLQNIYSEIVTKFHSHNITSPEVNAEWLLSKILKLKKSDFILNDDYPVSKEQTDKIQSFVARHVNGEPIQYLTGSTEFYNTTVLVGPGVLIPRPETERVVDIALELYKNDNGAILDLCTGSGCILFALSRELSYSTQCVGIEISDTAIKWALKNLNNDSEYFYPSNISFIQGNLFEPLRRDFKFELITANPPYISSTEFNNLPFTVKNFEPQMALLADNNGLRILENIAEKACDYLERNGWLICEIGEAQGKSALKCFDYYGLKNTKILTDNTGRERIITGQNKD